MICDYVKSTVLMANYIYILKIESYELNVADMLT